MTPRHTTFEDFRVTGFVQEGEAGDAKIDVLTASSLDALRATFARERLHEGDQATRLLVRNRLVMSDTTDEWRDHLEAINRAEGRVLIHGLGLGCYLKAILAKPEVTHVDVVELEADVLRLVAPYYDGDGRVTFHHADALAHTFPKGVTWDVAWHDIWAEKCTDDLAQHAILNRRYARRVGWQGCWAHETLLYYRRHERASGW